MISIDSLIGILEEVKFYVPSFYKCSIGFDRKIHIKLSVLEDKMFLRGKILNQQVLDYISFDMEENYD